MEISQTRFSAYAELKCDRFKEERLWGFLIDLRLFGGDKIEDGADRQGRATAVPKPQKRDDADRSQPPAVSKPGGPERSVKGNFEPLIKDPTWETVELYIQRALMNGEEFVILQLSYPKIPFIQANMDTDTTMCLEASVLDEQTGSYHIFEKIIDADTCRDAFRLYYESGEVRDLDTFSPLKW